jgi:hypothetical protein
LITLIADYAIFITDMMLSFTLILRHYIIAIEDISAPCRHCRHFISLLISYITD